MERECQQDLDIAGVGSVGAPFKDAGGRPKNNLSLYAVNLKGEVGGAALWSGARYAVCRAGEEARLVESAFLFKKG